MFRRKSLFTVLLALIVSLSMLPTFKLEAHAATVNASTLAELQQAINDSTDATEIVLTADIPLTATVTVPAGKVITLSGGFTLTRTNNAIAFDIKEGASLTWQDIILDGNAQDTNYKSAVMCDGHVTNLTGESPVVGSYRQA